MLKYTLGRGGLISPELKREGDGCTPLGAYTLREVWYRADRVSTPDTKLPIREIAKDDCWCDDAEHALYNKHFRHSGKSQHNTPASFEHLWRKDGAYDVIVVIGYNDAPPIPHKGSAIFIHCNHDDGRPTAGCVAMAKEELLEMLKPLSGTSQIEITKDAVRIII